MRQTIFGGSLILLILLAPSSGVGQDGGAAAPAGGDPGAVLTEFMNEELAREAGQPPRPQLPAAGTLETLAAFDSSSAAAYVAALRGLYEYQARGFEHRSRVFAWQYYSSLIIFGIVHLIVLTGLYFSWIQFRKGWAEGMESEMELSHTGIKVRSSVLGVIILVVSLVFFYLYLVHIYPIEEIF